MNDSLGLPQNGMHRPEGPAGDRPPADVPRGQPSRVNHLALMAEVVRGMREASFVVDAGWHCTFLNERAEELCGHRDEVLGRSLWEVAPSLAGTKVEADLRRAMTERIALEFKALYPANQRWQEMRLLPVEGGLILFLHDVHDREIAEQTRLQTVSELLLAQQISRAGSWYRDFATGRIEATPELCRIFGRSSIPPFREQLGTMYGPEAWRQLAELREQAQSGKGGELEVPAIRGDGAEIWIHTRWDAVSDVGGKVVGIRGIVQDITERHQAEESERRRAAELAAIMDTVPIPVFIAHDPGCLRLSRNRAAEELLRNPCGTGSGSTGPVDNRPQYIRAFRDRRELRRDELPAERAARGEIVHDFEFSLRFDDGSVRELIAHAVPLWDEAMRPRGSIVVVVDETEQKRARAALVARWDELLSFVRDAPAAIAMFDREMNYLAASQRWIADFGRGNRRLEGLNHYQVHPDLPETWKEVHRRGLLGEPQGCENDQWTRPDGTTMWLRWNLSPWRDDQGRIGGIILLSEDITPRMAAEQALRESEERLRLGLEAGRMRSFEIHVTSGSFEWSEIESGLTGCVFAVGQAPSMSDCCRLHPEDVAMVRARFLEARTTGEFNMEFRLLDADGTVRWLAGRGRFVQGSGHPEGPPDGADGRLRRFLSVSFEITERKRAELAAAEGRRMLDGIVESAMDAIISTDDGQRIVQFNAAAARILGCAADVAIGTSLARFIPDVFGISPILDRPAGANGKNGSAELVTARRAGGESFLAEISTSQVEIDGRAIHIVVLRDVSSRVQLEQEVLEVGLREQQRIGRELHDDICQRMVALEFMVSALARKIAREAPASAEKAVHIGENLRRMMNATRFLARGMSSSALAADALVAAIRELLPNVRESFGIRCYYDGPEHLRVRDELASFHLHRIIQEAIGNAVRHGRASEVGVLISTGPGWGTLTIRDNGCGFPDVMSAKAGMGLRTMRYRMAQIGGTMEIRSRPIGGTDVVCTFGIED